MRYSQTFSQNMTDYSSRKTAFFQPWIAFIWLSFLDLEDLSYSNCFLHEGLKRIVTTHDLISECIFLKLGKHILI